MKNPTEICFLIVNRSLLFQSLKNIPGLFLRELKNPELDRYGFKFQFCHFLAFELLSRDKFLELHT